MGAREGSAGVTSLQGAPGLSQRQCQSHLLQCLCPSSKPCLFLSGSGCALVSVGAAPSPAPRHRFGDLPSQGQTTGCFSLTSTFNPLAEGHLVGAEAPWLHGLGSLRPQPPTAVPVSLHTAARARRHSAQRELKKIGIFIPMEVENYDPGEGRITHIYR